VVVAVGETVTDPEAPDAGKPVPLQLFAFVLLHMSVEDWPLGIEGAKAESFAVGAGVAACATTTVGGSAGCRSAAALRDGTNCQMSCSTSV
jgi:hypothetical protein